MLKNASYKEKFALISAWMPIIIDAVKKDLKNDHLRGDIAFVRNYFQGKNPSKLTVEELANAYSHAIANGENSEELGEFLTNRWLLKHSDLYHYFEQELSKISPNFNELELLEKKASEKIMEDAVAQFGAPRTYLFCVLNSVVFPEEIYTTLDKKAKQSSKQEQEEAIARKETETVEAMKRNYEQHIARLTDKYEKKLSGMEKKYHQDVDSLKKQLANLQRKLNDKV